MPALAKWTVTKTDMPIHFSDTIKSCLVGLVEALKPQYLELVTYKTRNRTETNETEQNKTQWNEM